MHPLSSPEECRLPENVCELTDTHVFPEVSLAARQKVYQTITGYALTYTGANSIEQLRSLGSILKGVENSMEAEVKKYSLRSSWHGIDPAKAQADAHRNANTRKEDVIDTVLQRHPQAAGLYRRLRGPEKNDCYAPTMLVDLRATAALFTEIAFGKLHTPSHQNAPSDALVVDLGAGSGILTLAEIICATRAGYKVIAHGYDRIASDVLFSQQTLEQAVSQLPMRPDIRMIKRNITEDALYEELKDKDAATPIRVWVSETFGYGTPSYAVRNGKPDWNPSAIGRIGKLQADIDPLHIVSTKFLDHFPDFGERVQSEQVVMFPNLFDGSLKTKELNGKLALPLQQIDLTDFSKIGSTAFGDFMDLGRNTRWDLPPMIQKQQSPNSKKPTKKKR